MRAITYQAVEEVRVQDVPEPAVQDPTDVVIRVTLAAICGSDLHLYHGRIPGLVPGYVLGHEYVGVVQEVGPQVRTLVPGDRVTGAFNPACGACGPCRRGQYNLCPNGGVLGYGLAFGNLGGTQAEYARIPFADTTLRKVPDHVTDEQAIFTGDVLTTAYGAVKNSGLVPGETVAVIGAGPVGLMAVQSARVRGAGRVIAVDLIPERLELAERLGAVPINAAAANPVSRVLSLTGGDGADVVVEAVGGTKTILMAFDLVRPGGRVMAVGITSEETLEYPLMASLSKDVTFRIGVANVVRDIDETLSLVAAGRIDPTAVVSHRLPLAEVPDGYRLFAERKILKALVVPD